MKKLKSVIQRTLYVPAHEVDDKIKPVVVDGKQVQFNRITGLRNYLKKHGLKYFFKEKSNVSIHEV